MNPHFAHTPAIFKEQAEPDTPDSGIVLVYAKADGNMYSKDDTGVESPVTGSATVSFNESTAELSVGTSTTSLSALSGTSGGGLTHFTEARAATGVNASRAVVSLTATGAEANIDAAIVPKGTGAFSLQIADGTSAGGNKRGTYAFDGQRSRTNQVHVASGKYSGIVAGASNRTENGDYSFIGAGYQNWTSGDYSTAPGGRENFPTGIYSAAFGYKAYTSRHGQFSHASGQFSVANLGVGDSQYCRFILRRKTTNNSPTEIFLDGSAKRLTIEAGKINDFLVQIIGAKSDGTAIACYLRRVTIANVAGTTSLVGSVQTLGTDTAASTSISITADDTNDALKIEVTGIAAETWRWVAIVHGSELLYGT